MARKNRRKNKQPSAVVSNKGRKSNSKELVFEDPEPLKSDDHDKQEEAESEQNAQLDSFLSGAIPYYYNVVSKSVTMPKVFQLLGIFFVVNMLGVIYKGYFDKANGVEADQAEAVMPAIVAVMTIGAVILEISAVSYISYENYRAQMEAIEKASKDNDKETVEKQKKLVESPKLPEFEYIYSVILPLSVTILAFPSKVIAVAACVVQVPFLKLPVRLAVAYISLYQMGIGELPTSQAILAPLIFSMMYILMEYFVGKSLSVTERLLFSHLLVALGVFVTDKVDATLIIFKGLTIGFGSALAISVCLSMAYREQAPGSASAFGILTMMYGAFIGDGIMVSRNILEKPLQMAPWSWLSKYISSDDSRKTTLSYWFMVTAIILPSVFVLYQYLGNSLRRKVWHFAIFGSLCKSFVDEPQLTSLALVGIFGILAMVELLRANKLPPFGNAIDKLFSPFEDEKDRKGKYVLSYLYLVLGVGIPLWLNNGQPKLSSLVGLVGLGIGDALAALVGKYFPFTHWPDSDKTIAGSICYFVSVALALTQYLKYLPGNSTSISSAIITAFVMAFFEGNMTMNDNIVVPVIGWICMEACDRLA